MIIKLTQQLTPSPLTILPLWRESDLTKALKPLGLRESVLDLISEDFQKNLKELRVVYSEQFGRVLLLGLGSKRELSAAKLRTAFQAAILSAKQFREPAIQIILQGFNILQRPEYLEILAFSCGFANYSFDHYKPASRSSNFEQINLLVASSSKRQQAAVETGLALAQATNSARDLANHPGNIATPTHLAQHAKQLAQQYQLRLKVLNQKDMRRLGMGLLLGVSKGSDEPPKFIVLESGPKSDNPIILIGKGLTFDSGGISIKKSDRLEEMKYDMCGGAAVLGIMEAAARLKLKLRLVGLIPASENLLSGRATRPGDVLTALDGTTVEIINTDAEGRLILADAVAYAKKYYAPRLILDLATLTGAVIVALGNEYGGAMTNAPEQQTAILKASRATGEKVWFLPLVSEYQRHLKSSIAEIKNMADKSTAGSIMAGLFLQKFVQGTPWVHFDLSGPAWTTRPQTHFPVGASGWGVYLVTKFLQTLK